MTERRQEPDQLIDPVDDLGIDEEKDLVADEDRAVEATGIDRAPQDQGEVQPAEEAAMHLTDPPPMGDGDGDVED
jgi:hypothetical protein